jgi:hypothetical protein
VGGAIIRKMTEAYELGTGSPLSTHRCYCMRLTARPSVARETTLWLRHYSAVDFAVPNSQPSLSRNFNGERNTGCLLT